MEDNGIALVKLDEINKKLAYIKPEKEFQEKTLQEAEKKFEPINKHYQELKAKLHYLEQTSLNSTQYFELVSQVDIVHKTLQEVEKSISEAKKSLKAIKDANFTTYTDLEYYTTQRETLIHDVKAQNINIDSKSAQIDPIYEKSTRGVCWII